MPSSTSSSERTWPQGRWARLFALALGATVLCAGWIELGLRLRGFQPAVQDSPQAWAEQRERAPALGPDALALVGASRIQLALDLDVLRARTGLEPVQLAVDGGSFVPLLADLAADPTFRGRVLVDYTDQAIAEGDGEHRVREWLAEARDWQDASPSARIDAWLSTLVMRSLASFADGTDPGSALLRRVLARQPAGQYLVTFADRSRAADYSQVVMPEFAFARALRHIQRMDLASQPLSRQELQERIGAAIRAVEATSPGPGAQARIAAVAGDVARIRARGGDVAFVRFPTSGAVAAYDRRRYPDAGFWRYLLATAGAQGVDARELPQLSRFPTPDGSHIDGSQRARFTAGLVAALPAAFLSRTTRQ